MKQGVWTALITPFDEKGAFDQIGLKNNIARQSAAGVAGIVALGTTGESPTLSREEKERVIYTAVDSGLDVIVGTGSNCTKTTIADTKKAAALGAKAALIISPYYNRPTEEGLYLHFSAIADQSPIPLIIYDHPGRTGVALTLPLRRRLASIPNIHSLKDAAGSFPLMEATLNFMKVYSGDDSLAYELSKRGGEGVISVLSNLFPQLMVDLWNGSETALANLTPFFEASVLESNPIPIKAMMQLYGFPAGPCRLPLCSPTPETQARLKDLCSEEIKTLHH